MRSDRLGSNKNQCGIQLIMHANVVHFNSDGVYAVYMKLSVTDEKAIIWTHFNGILQNIGSFQRYFHVEFNFVIDTIRRC